MPAKAKLHGQAFELFHGIRELFGGVLVGDQYLRRALPILLENRPDRAKAVLDSLSDMTTTPAPTAHTQAAAGAPPF